MADTSLRPTQQYRAYGHTDNLPEIHGKVNAKFGYSAALGTAITSGTPSSWIDLWPESSQRTFSDDSPFTPYIASSSASDTQEVRVTFLDNDYKQVGRTVTLTGQTPVEVPETNVREIFRLQVLSGGDLLGTVSCTTANNFTAGVPDNNSEIQAVMQPYENRTQQLFGIVPADSRAYLNFAEFSVTRASGGAGAVNGRFQMRRPGSDTFITLREVAITSQSFYKYDLSDIVLEPKSAYRFRIYDVSDTATTVSCTLNFTLVDISDQ